jgi:hypothetical protein
MLTVVISAVVIAWSFIGGMLVSDTATMAYGVNRGPLSSFVTICSIAGASISVFSNSLAPICWLGRAWCAIELVAALEMRLRKQSIMADYIRYPLMAIPVYATCDWLLL